MVCEVPWVYWVGIYIMVDGKLERTKLVVEVGAQLLSRTKEVDVVDKGRESVV
jgi:hypothetical protein